MLRLRFAFAGIVLALGGATDVRAETSAMTDAFVASAARAYAVLRQSDDLALADATSANLRRVARRDLAVQTESTAALENCARSAEHAARLAAQTPSIDGLGPVLHAFSAGVLPIPVNARAAASEDQALLGRLAAVHGVEFDALYAASQLEALQRIERTYVDYIKNGDDPGLRRLSVRFLPSVRQLLANLRHR